MLMTVTFSYAVAELDCLFAHRLITLCYGSLMTGYLVYFWRFCLHTLYW